MPDGDEVLMTPGIVGFARFGPFAPIDRRMMQRGERAFEVHLDHGVKVVLRQREDHPVTQNAGVVDQNVDVAVGVDGLVDHLLGLVEVADIGAVDFGLPAASADFLHHFLGWGLVGALAVFVAA